MKPINDNKATNDAQRSETVRLRGTVASGSGEAVAFTELPWVKKQFMDKLGIAAFPGTFNITVLPEDEEKLTALKNAPGIDITPENKNYCTARAFPALVGGKERGAVIIPLVPDYPQSQLEIVSSSNIRQALALKDWDVVEVEIG